MTYYITITVLLIVLYFIHRAIKPTLTLEDDKGFVKHTKIFVCLFFVFLYVLPLFGLLKRVAPGEVGVVVNLFGSERGAEEKELTVGYHFVAPWKNLYIFPIFEQNHQWTEKEGFTFQTSEGLSVHADIGITFNLIPTKVHELFCKYRRGMEEITHLFIRNNIRDAMNRSASKMKIEELYGPKKEIFFNEILAHVKLELEPLGFNISHLYIIGQFHVPNLVMEALNKKIEATQTAQQRENELREAEAQARKEIAKSEGVAKSLIIKAKSEAESMLIEAESKAKANHLIQQSITKELLESQAIQKWDGKMPEVMPANGSTPFIYSINSKDAK